MKAFSGGSLPKSLGIPEIVLGCLYGPQSGLTPCNSNKIGNNSARFLLFIIVYHAGIYVPGYFMSYYCDYMYLPKAGNCQ